MKPNVDEPISWTKFTVFVIIFVLIIGGLWAFYEHSLFAPGRVREQNEAELLAFMESQGLTPFRAVDMADVYVQEDRIKMSEVDWEAEILGFLASHDGKVFFWGLRGRWTFSVAVLEEDGIAYELEIYLG